MGGLCLLVKLHREGSAPDVCTAGLFRYVCCNKRQQYLENITDSDVLEWVKVWHLSQKDDIVMWWETMVVRQVWGTAYTCTALHCKDTALHCIVMYCIVLCSLLLYNTVLYYLWPECTTVQVLYSILILHFILIVPHYTTLLSCSVLPLHYTASISQLVHYTTLHYTILHYTTVH